MVRGKLLRAWAECLYAGIPKSVVEHELAAHALTNAQVIEQFLPVRFVMAPLGSQGVRVSIDA